MSQKKPQDTLKSPITELATEAGAFHEFTDTTATPSGEETNVMTLVGSSVQPATFIIGEKEVPLGDVVNAAFVESELSAEEWNALEEDLREQCIAIALNNMLTAAGDTVSTKEETPVEPAKETVATEPVTPPAAEPKKEETPAVTPVKEATPEPVVEEAPAAELTPEERVLKALQERFPHLKAFDVDTQSIIALMERYLTFMGPNTITDEKIGALRQRELYNTMLTALKAANWQVAVEVVLYYFSTYRKEHFQNRLLMRFSDKLNLNRTELLRFQALQQAFAIGGDPRGRQLVSQQIDFDRLVSLFSDNDIKERLLQIFKI